MGKSRLPAGAIRSICEYHSGRPPAQGIVQSTSKKRFPLRIFDCFGEGVLLVNSAGVIVWMTTEIREGLGDIVGQKCSCLCHGHKISVACCPIRSALAGGSGDPAVTEMVTAVGDPSYMETTIYVQTGDNGDRVESIALVLKDVTERVWAEQSLQELTRKLNSAERELEGKSSALREILSRVHCEKKQLAARIGDNIDRAVLPVLSQLRDRLDESDQAYVDTLRLMLRDIASPFANCLESRFGRLTPRELEISNLVRSGLSSKEIAALLNRSEGTVRQQRKQIRKKFGIAGDSTNLSLFLRSFESESSIETAYSVDYKTSGSGGWRNSEGEGRDI